MHKIETLPISISSLFHGCSVLLIIFFLILGTGGLYYVSQHQIYEGSGNNCLGKNTVAMYGQDNFLYCPNTYLISNLNITDTSFGVAVQTKKNSVVKDFSIVDTEEFPPNSQSIRIDYSGKTYWYFNLNPNSSVSMNFTQITSESLTLSVDDDDLMKLPLGDSSAQVFAKNDYGSRGHRIQLKSRSKDDANQYVGYVTFYYTQTSFGKIEDEPDLTCSRGVNCLWEFDFGEDVCLLIYYPQPRIWYAESSGHCLIMIQAGYDREWTFFLMTISALFIFLIVFINGFVAYLRSQKEKENDKFARSGILNDNL